MSTDKRLARLKQLNVPTGLRLQRSRVHILSSLHLKQLCAVKAAPWRFRALPGFAARRGGALQPQPFGPMLHRAPIPMPPEGRCLSTLVPQRIKCLPLVRRRTCELSALCLEIYVLGTTPLNTNYPLPSQARQGAKPAVCRVQPSLPIARYRKLREPPRASAA